MKNTYYTPKGGHPDQSQLLTDSDRATMTTGYAVIPKGTLRDITASYLPFWQATRLWVIARPLTGFAETFSHYIMEVSPGGGSERAEGGDGIEQVLFVASGEITLSYQGKTVRLEHGGYAYLSPKEVWEIKNSGNVPVSFHWIRKRYQQVEGLSLPPSFTIADEGELEPIPMPGTEGKWATTRFVEPADLRHDMHVNIVTLHPGAAIPFPETHVMEHGLYVLQGKGVYRLNQDWVEVEAGDYLWLRAFCPQACYAGGPLPFRYLLYKDVNRHMPLELYPH